MTAPDAPTAIASLFAEAEQLAAAANAKLEEALAIAQQQQRIETFNADRH
jgi:hypothetical protein